MLSSQYWAQCQDIFSASPSRPRRIPAMKLGPATEGDPPSVCREDWLGRLAAPSGCGFYAALHHPTSAAVLDRDGYNGAADATRPGLCRWRAHASQDPRDRGEPKLDSHRYFEIENRGKRADRSLGCARSLLQASS